MDDARRDRGLKRTDFEPERYLFSRPPEADPDYAVRNLVKGESPRYWGAKRGTQWPSVAIRRYLLYDVFLHELGHLQVVLPQAKSVVRKFASETKAEEFAAYWRRRFWSVPFDHPDPAHHPPTEEELRTLDE